MFDDAKNIPVQPVFPERIRMMWGYYGKREDKTCKTCKHLLRFRHNHQWLKCELSKMSSSTATDWRAGWTACGKHEEEK